MDQFVPCRRPGGSVWRCQGERVGTSADLERGENGADAVREFTETKAVWVELTGATRDPFKVG